MHWKKLAIEYLGFSRKDRIAVIGLIVLILGVYFLPQLVSRNGGYSSTPDSTVLKSILKMETKESPTLRGYDENEDFRQAGYPYDRKENHARRNRGELFDFDPNTTPFSDWKKLGVRDKTIGTIQNYLAKGGKFRKPEDLKRVYGLFEDEYKRLEPYIRIGKGQYAIDNEQESIDKSQNEKSFFPEKKKVSIYNNLTVHDINSTDTNQLIALPGIGSKLALRIINFRDKLGGFYSVEQVGETFGLADSTFQKIKKYLKLGSSPIKKINLNTVKLEELKSHPYIRFPIAGPIIAYRNQHGDFKKVEDLKNVMVVTDEVFNKISAYLTLE